MSECHHCDRPEYSHTGFCRTCTTIIRFRTDEQYRAYQRRERARRSARKRGLAWAEIEERWPVISPSVTVGLWNTLTKQDKLDALNRTVTRRYAQKCICSRAMAKNRGLCRSCEHRARMALDPAYVAWKRAYVKRWNEGKKQAHLSKEILDFDYPVPTSSVTPGLWETVPNGLAQHAAKNMLPLSVGKRQFNPHDRIEMMVWLMAGAAVSRLAKTYKMGQETAAAIRDELKYEPALAERHPRVKTTSSQYRGLSLCKATGMWRVSIAPGGEMLFLGRFSDELEGAHAYDLAACELLGDAAKPNFGSNGRRT